MKIGIVFEGGGGKGAFQIGVWNALRELNLEQYITTISGTSVGALNAALLFQGNYANAERIWNSITDQDILSPKEIMSDSLYSNDDYLFSSNKLSDMIEYVISTQKINHICKECFVTCRYRDKPNYRYFKWSDYYDVEMRRKILLASASIPVVFKSVNIDNEWYVDGGANGDNTPVEPLRNKGLDYIIIVHLSSKVKRVAIADNEIEIFPSQSLGGFLDGTLDFDPKSTELRINLGFVDGMNALKDIADICLLSAVNKSHPARQRLGVKLISESYSSYKKYMEEQKMTDFKFTNEEARKEYEQKLAALKRASENVPTDTAYLWDKTAEKYASKMLKVKQILQSEGISEQITTKMFRDIDTFLKRCADAEFHIALVGAIKAGKSTLINALLGYEYASTKVTPETASLTKFKKGSSNYVKVTFYSTSEWNTLWKSATEAKATVFLEEYEKLGAESEKGKWLNLETQTSVCESKEALVQEIKRWTSSKSVCHYFVKEVEVGLAEFDLPTGVVLVDTPGLDDVVEYRSDITRDYIDRANAVLVCVKSDALTGQEMATIYSVFANTRYNPEKVYIIATQVDTLNRPIENWKEQKVEWIKYLKGQSAYNSMYLAVRNLVPVSAYLYTLLSQYDSLNEDDDRYYDLSSILMKLRVKSIVEKYQELLDFTNIRKLKSKIQKEIVANYKKMLIDDIVSNYEQCKQSINEALVKIRATQEEIIETSQGGIEEIQKKQAEYDAKYQEAEKDKKELDSLLKKLKSETSKRADELEAAIKKLAN